MPKCDPLTPRAAGAFGGFDGLQVGFGAPPLRHVFHRQNEQFAVVTRLKLACVKQHHPAPNDREGVLELEVVEDRTLTWFLRRSRWRRELTPRPFEELEPVHHFHGLRRSSG